ncbi:MAG: UbiD family decarboxylase [Candidatus Eisenbacteria bacterium]
MKRCSRLPPGDLGAAGFLLRAARSRIKPVGNAPVQQAMELDLARLPILRQPLDGGPFVTWPMVATRHPVTGGRNLGTYRMHVFDPQTTGMHMQIQKGGGFHYHVAEERGESLPVCVVLGGDPVLMLASIAPPENIDELAFAAYLRGSPLPMTRAKTVPLDVPARAEFIIEGEVPPRERRMEGPFGDHFGHYSHAAEFRLPCQNRDPPGGRFIQRRWSGSRRRRRIGRSAMRCRR